MKINSANSYQNYQPHFNATYPVVHWIAETNGSFAPVANLEITKKLQGKIIRVLNKTIFATKKSINPREQKLCAYIASSDIDYRRMPVVRSFYDRVSSSPDKFQPVSYIISGANVEEFNDLLAKKIGKSKKLAKSNFSNPYSPQTIEAIKTYEYYGLQFVNDRNIRIKDANNITYVLHTKFEIIRNKLGKIKDYKFLDARFLPEKGPKNPLENFNFLIGYV